LEGANDDLPNLWSFSSDPGRSHSERDYGLPARDLSLGSLSATAFKSKLGPCEVDAATLMSNFAHTYQNRPSAKNTVAIWKAGKLKSR